MKLNNKGFVASTLMYSLLILFLFLILGLIALLSNRKMILDKLKNDIKEEVNSTKKYTYYENGTPIYFNPVTNKICGNYTEENSLNETKTGCLKWYIFNDDINKASVNMILDHNTTYNVAYNSTGNNSEMKEIKDELDALVNQSKWEVTPRLITADEIAHIVGADSDDTIKWKSNKGFGTDDIDTKVTWFYLNGSGTTNSSENGWRKRVSTEKGTNQYAWLFDYTNNCEDYGCNINADISNVGYWTSNKVTREDAHSQAWFIYSIGSLDYALITRTDIGVRPVITISKKELTKPFTVTYDYTGNPQSFVRPVPGNYKIELWGAQGFKLSRENEGNGGYVKGNVELKSDYSIYVYIGAKGTNSSEANKYIYNGGGMALKDYSVNKGGGATDIRIISSDNWYNFDSLKSRVMVAGAGGADSNVNNIIGGNAGGLIGYDGVQSNTYDFVSERLAGSQTSGGGKFISSGAWVSKFGIGGAEHDSNEGTGGGGYYGGGLTDNSGGSGGSSFISGHNGCVAITNDSTEDNIIQRNDSNGNKCTDGTTDITCSYHYSGLKFTDTVMIDGAGCKWTTEKTSDCSGMPTHDGKSTMTGNSGNGYAKITYLGN